MSRLQDRQPDEIESVKKAVTTLAWTADAQTLRHHRFGVGAYAALDARRRVVEEARRGELGHEELFVIVERQHNVRVQRQGTGSPSRLGRLPPEPKVKRPLRARRRSRIPRCSAIAASRASHEVSAWEYFFAAYGVVDEDPDRAIAEIEAGLAEKPGSPGLYFHLACIYTRCRPPRRGWRGALDRALELDPEASEVGGRGRGSRAVTRSPGRRSPAARSRSAGNWIRLRAATTENGAVALAGEPPTSRSRPSASANDLCASRRRTAPVPPASLRPRRSSP